MAWPSVKPRKASYRRNGGGGSVAWFSSEGAPFWGLGMGEGGKFRNRCVLRTPQLAKEPCLLLLSLSLFILLSFSGYPVLFSFIPFSVSLGFSPAGGRQGADVKCMCVVEDSRKGSMF